MDYSGIFLRCIRQLAIALTGLHWSIHPNNSTTMQVDHEPPNTPPIIHLDHYYLDTGSPGTVNDDGTMVVNRIVLRPSVRLQSYYNMYGLKAPACLAAVATKYCPEILKLRSRAAQFYHTTCFPLNASDEIRVVWETQLYDPLDRLLSRLCTDPQLATAPLHSLTQAVLCEAFPTLPCTRKQDLQAASHYPVDVAHWIIHGIAEDPDNDNNIDMTWTSLDALPSPTVPQAAELLTLHEDILVKICASAGGHIWALRLTCRKLRIMLHFPLCPVSTQAQYVHGLAGFWMALSGRHGRASQRRLLSLARALFFADQVKADVIHSLFRCVDPVVLAGWYGRERAPMLDDAFFGVYLARRDDALIRRLFKNDPSFFVFAIDLHFFRHYYKAYLGLVVVEANTVDTWTRVIEEQQGD